MTKLILIGAGGHSKVIQDIVTELKEIELHAILDNRFDRTKEIDGIINANTSLLENLNIEDFMFCISIGNNLIRKNLFAELDIPIENYLTLIHPSAVVSKTAIIGYGSVIMPNSVINADASVGNHCIINTSAVVEHDNELKDYVHISPSSTLSGTVNIGEGTHIGSGAVVIPGKSIGNWSTVGAGAVVTKDLLDNLTAVGVPAKVIKQI